MIDMAPSHTSHLNKNQGYAYGAQVYKKLIINTFTAYNRDPTFSLGFL